MPKLLFIATIAANHSANQKIDG